MIYVWKKILILCLAIYSMCSCILAFSQVTKEDINLKLIESRGRIFDCTINWKNVSLFEEKVKKRVAYIINLWIKMGYKDFKTKNKLVFTNPNTQEEEIYFGEVNLIRKKTNKSQIIRIKWFKNKNCSTDYNTNGRSRKRTDCLYKHRKHQKLIKNNDFYIADTTYYLVANQGRVTRKCDS